MPVWSIVLLVIIVILIAIIVALTIIGKKAQKKQAEQQAQIEQYKQNVTMLIIDKKRMRLNQSGLPQSVIDSTPKLLRRSKLPIVKAKVGPQIMTLVADEKIFDMIPVKKEVKAVVSGIYITSVKGLHGKLDTSSVKKKKGRFKQFVEKLQEKAGAKPLK
jgi:type II secretory pathway pseudopilin PulG